jgi:hypothetical protein
VVEEYRLIKITVPGVYYASNKDDIDCASNTKATWHNWAYVDNLENSIGIIMNQFSLVDTDLCYESKGYSVYVNGITITLSDGQFEYL